MHGFQLFVILFDVINVRHSEAGARRQRENTDNFTRQKNVLFEFGKKHYNAYNEKKRNMH